MAMIVEGNIADAFVMEGESKKSGNAYRMVGASLLVDFGTAEKPRKQLLSVQMDSEFPEEAIQKFLAQINRDQFQKVTVRVTNLSAQAYGSGAQNRVSVEFISPAIKLPDKSEQPQHEQKPEQK